MHILRWHCVLERPRVERYREGQAVTVKERREKKQVAGKWSDVENSVENSVGNAALLGLGWWKRVRFGGKVYGNGGKVGRRSERREKREEVRGKVGTGVLDCPRFAPQKQNLLYLIVGTAGGKN